MLVRRSGARALSSSIANEHVCLACRLRIERRFLHSTSSPTHAQSGVQHRNPRVLTSQTQDHHNPRSTPIMMSPGGASRARSVMTTTLQDNTTLEATHLAYFAQQCRSPSQNRSSTRRSVYERKPYLGYHDLHQRIWLERRQSFTSLTSIRRFSSNRDHHRTHAPASAPAYVRNGRTSAAEAGYPSLFTFGDSKAKQPHRTSFEPLSGRSEKAPEDPNGIRAQLRKWQEIHGKTMVPDLHRATVVGEEDLVNSMSRLASGSTKPQQDLGGDDPAENFISSNSAESDINAVNEYRVIHQGDLCELYHVDGRPSMVAVFLRLIGEQGGEGQFYDLNGRVSYAKMNSIRFSIPQWIPPNELEQLAGYLPKIEEIKDLRKAEESARYEDVTVPRAVSAPIVHKLRKFDDAVLEIYRQHAHRLDRAHEILAHEKDLRYTSLSAASRELLGLGSKAPSTVEIYAVRRALAEDRRGFLADAKSVRQTGLLQVRSKQSLRVADEVRGWLRIWQEDLARDGKLKPRQLHPATIKVNSFIEKARKIVLTNRQNRPLSVHYGLSPSVTQFPLGHDKAYMQETVEEVFDESDTALVEFFQAWCCFSEFNDDTAMQSIPPILLQALDLYEADVRGYNRTMGHLFLQELGVLYPGENHARYDPHILLPASSLSRPLEQLLGRINQLDRSAEAFPDTMKDLRHDWGDLPVYCIDEASAFEIDDGVSVEDAGQGSDGKKQYWLHIHIANPTAHFDKDHMLSRMAKHMCETLYTPDATYTMLPSWVAADHFSLGPNRPCLTISALIDEDGNRLEERIRNGLIRNVKRLTYKQVDSLLATEDESGVRYPETVITTAPPSQSPRAVQMDPPYASTPAELADLRLLLKLATTQVAKRKAEGGLFYNMSRTNVKVYTKPNQVQSGLDFKRPYLKGRRTVFGDPVITAHTKGFHNWFHLEQEPSHILVQELMLLACDTSGKWCADREVPIIYRGTVRNTYHDPEKYFEEEVVPNILPNGNLPFAQGTTYMFKLGFTSLSTEPRKHRFLGLHHYTKATSPLRRYGDMVLHWQIEAALRYEAQTGQSLVVTPTVEQKGTVERDRSFLPMSAKALDGLIIGLQPRETMITRSKARADEHWMHQLLYRKIYHPELSGGPLSDIFPKLHTIVQRGAEEYNILRGNEKSILCSLLELNTGVSMMIPAALSEECTRGSLWEVEVLQFDLYLKTLRVKPIRKIRDNAFEDDSWRGPLQQPIQSNSKESLLV